MRGAVEELEDLGFDRLGPNSGFTTPNLVTLHKFLNLGKFLE